MSVRRGAVALVVAAFVACDSPLGPFHPLGQGEPVPVNRLIEDTISSGGGARTYSFNAEIGAQYVVYLMSLGGVVLLGVGDAATPYTIATVAAGPNATPLDLNPSNDFPTPLGGVYPIDVALLSGDSARFQFKIAKINTAPEAASSLFAFGDTVRESINHLADVDMFYAHGRAGQRIAAVVEPLGSDSGAVTLYLESESGGWWDLVPAAKGVPLMTTQPFTIPSDQDYRVTIRGTAWEGHLRHRGLYRFWTYVVDPRPEHIAAVLPIGTVVGGERMDQAVDLDDFTFQDTTGAELSVLLEGPRPFRATVSSPADSIIAGVADQDADTALFHHGSAAFRLSSSGVYKVQVTTSPAAHWLVADTGAYRIMFVRVDRRPEAVASAVSVGDTVKGEALYPAGDIDEFTVTATAGTRHTAWFRLTSSPAQPYSAVALNVIDPGTGELLASVAAGVALPFLQTPTFTVPTAGAVTVRVAPVSGGPGAAAAYEFFLGPPPVP